MTAYEKQTPTGLMAKTSSDSGLRKCFHMNKILLVHEEMTKPPWHYKFLLWSLSGPDFPTLQAEVRTSQSPGTAHWTPQSHSNTSKYRDAEDSSRTAA